MPFTNLVVGVPYSAVLPISGEVKSEENTTLNRRREAAGHSPLVKSGEKTALNGRPEIAGHSAVRLLFAA